DLAHVQPEGESFDTLGKGTNEGVSTAQQTNEGNLAMIKQVSSTGYLRKRLPQELMVLQGGQANLFDAETSLQEASSTDNNVAAAVKQIATMPQFDDRAKAKMQGYEGDACGDCGNYTLVRNGTCMKCNTCGATSGCS
ncbi:MAG: vitamin B12-dependent ribonucleotide reductase, partial [Rhodobacterales bacterium]